EDLDRIPNGREGISEFVGQHREEFVLPAIIFLDIAVKPSIVEDDRGATGEVFREVEVRKSESPIRGLCRHDERTQDSPSGRERDDHRAPDWGGNRACWGDVS